MIKSFFKKLKTFGEENVNIFLKNPIFLPIFKNYIMTTKGSKNKTVIFIKRSIFKNC